MIGETNFLAKMNNTMSFIYIILSNLYIIKPKLS